MSRRSLSANAATTSAAVTAAASPSGHQLSTYAAVACAQPMGDSHDSALSPMSPAARTA